MRFALCETTQKKLPTGQGLIGSVVLGALSVVESAERLR